ncbi:hypothetical protein Y695_01338 [Hydrogenophaga sp. T4]|nr:hypothetical protein Y695_01338 [Hydrogenophaga sp. T4]
MADAGFSPIIEPVRETLSGLQRALNSICDANGSAIVIVNPRHGDHAEDGDGISTLLSEHFSKSENVTAGILLLEETSTNEAINLYEKHINHKPAFIHAGFSEAKALAEALGDKLHDTKNFFIEANSGKLYRKHFQGSTRVLLRDGFRKRKNSEYQPVEEFSDLHITYPDEGCDGFGDFLIVGSEYSEGGGPAYAVAIHLTFIDPSKDDVMFIYHFVSITKDTPTDPAGKFSQALTKLIAKLDSGDSKLFESSAIAELRELHAKGHFPGLGYVKKLSMKHHIETLRNYLI